MLAGCEAIREAGSHFDNATRETPFPEAALKTGDDAAASGPWPAQNFDAVPARPPRPLSREESERMIEKLANDAAQARRADAEMRKSGQ